MGVKHSHNQCLKGAMRRAKQGLDSKIFICDECNEVEELTETKINKALIDVSKKQGFTPSLVNVEIHGTCAQCAQQQ